MAGAFGVCAFAAFWSILFPCSASLGVVLGHAKADYTPLK